MSFIMKLTQFGKLKSNVNDVRLRPEFQAISRNLVKCFQSKDDWNAVVEHVDILRTVDKIRTIHIE